MADYRASQNVDSLPEDTPPSVDSQTGPRETRNGSNYLLTDQTFFITHEPCIMCSMALLHSRVKEVIYLFPMSKTGGCGGSTCLPTLKGVNHQFTIFQWKAAARLVEEDIKIDPTIDV